MIRLAPAEGPLLRDPAHCRARLDEETDEFVATEPERARRGIDLRATDVGGRVPFPHPLDMAAPVETRERR